MYGRIATDRPSYTGFRKAISSLDQSLDNHFDQIDFVPSGMISLIGLITEKSCSSKNAPQSTLTSAGLIAYDNKKEADKRESMVEKVSMTQLTKGQTPVTTFMSLSLYSSTRSKPLPLNSFTGLVLDHPTIM